MYDAWPWGFSPRLGAVYSLDDETVVRFSAARVFGPVKNTGGSSHWQGFIGGYNVTAPAFPASSAFNWDAGWPSWPEPPFLVPQTLNGSNIPYWQPYDSGRLPEYYTWTLNMQRQLPGRFVVEAGYNAQLGRHLPSNLLSLNQVDPADLPGLRPAVRRRRRHQPDELADGLDAGAAGQHPLPVRHLPGIAVGAAGAAAVSAVPRHPRPAPTAASGPGDRAITRSC